ncbi:hypothetical protein GCM10029992_51980 [Glycomyces albus]
MQRLDLEHGGGRLAHAHVTAGSGGDDEQLDAHLGVDALVVAELAVEVDGALGMAGGALAVGDHGHVVAVAAQAFGGAQLVHGQLPFPAL